MRPQILLVSEFWHPIEHGGGERSAWTLAVGLSAEADVTVLTSRIAGLPAQETIKGIHIIRKIRSGSPGSLLGNLTRSLFFARSARRHAIALCRTTPFDVVHLMNTTSIMIAPALRNAGMTVTAHLNSPVPFCAKGDRMCGDASCQGRCTFLHFVSCLHKTASLGKLAPSPLVRHNPLAWFALWCRYRAFQRSLPAVHRWAAIGSGLVGLLDMHGVPRDKITLVPNPVDIESFLQLGAPKPGKTIKVGYVGALTDFKGVRLLAEITRDLGVELHMAGEGPLQSWLSTLPHVRLHGLVPEKKLAAFYDSVDIIVIPSLWPEAFGRVAVEAMAAARPVIASDNGGLHDILAGCPGARLVPIGDGTALRSALMQFLEKPRTISIEGGLCRQHVRTRYTVPHAIRLLRDVLTQNNA